MANKLPLFFNYSDLVQGRNFIASVRMIARVVAEHDGEEWWLNGVHPGAITESGTELNAAAFNFRNALRTIVFEYAQEADSFDAFQKAVAQFFNDTDSASVEEWNAAREAVRSGQVNDQSLVRVTGEPMTFEVQDVQRTRRPVEPPSAAELEEKLKAAA